MTNDVCRFFHDFFSRFYRENNSSLFCAFASSRRHDEWISNSEKCFVFGETSTFVASRRRNSRSDFSVFRETSILSRSLSAFSHRFYRATFFSHRFGERNIFRDLARLRSRNFFLLSFSCFPFFFFVSLVTSRKDRLSDSSLPECGENSLRYFPFLCALSFRNSATRGEMPDRNARNAKASEIEIVVIIRHVRLRHNAITLT